MRKVILFCCGGLSALALFGIMALTFFDVLGRKFVGHSIPGSLELTELLMVMVIFPALPLVSLRHEHVTFDSLDSVLPRAARWFQAKIMNILAALVFAGLGWLMWKTGTKVLDYGDTTAQLLIPKFPFVYAMALLLWICAAVHLRMLFEAIDDPTEQRTENNDRSAL